jgi:hypothetical protein
MAAKQSSVSYIAPMPTDSDDSDSVVSNPAGWWFKRRDWFFDTEYAQCDDVDEFFGTASRTQSCPLQLAADGPSCSSQHPDEPALSQRSHDSDDSSSVACVALVPASLRAQAQGTVEMVATDPVEQNSNGEDTVDMVATDPVEQNPDGKDTVDMVDE